MVKVLLIVVQGKPEGKSIPIVGPTFRIGRGTECHLRPNSEEVSRNHSEITLTETEAIVRDLGSRNGTWVNGQLLKGPHRLSSGELLKIGPLTFAVAIQGVPSSMPAAAAPVPAAVAVGRVATGALDDVPPDQIDAWLVSDPSRPTPDRPSGVYDGETVTFQTYREAKRGSSGSIPAAPPAEATPEEKLSQDIEAQLGSIEMLPEGRGDEAASYEDDTAPADAEGGQAAEEPGAEEIFDENNPFYTAKKETTAAAEPAKPSYKDSSDAASDILRKMLDRRRTPR